MTNEVRLGDNIAKLIGIWDRRKWLAILVFAAVSTTSAIVTFALPAIYQSTATVRVVGPQLPPDVVRPPFSGSPDSRLQTISQEVLSQPRLESLIHQFGLFPSVQGKLSADALVERMRRDIDVKPSVDRTGSMVDFTVKYQGPDASTVAQIANTLASAYVEENAKLRDRQATGAAEFLGAQLAEVKATLEQQERNVSDFKRQHHDELPEQMASNRQQLQHLTNQLLLNRENQTRIRNQIESAKSIQTISRVPVPATRQGPAAPAAPDSETTQLNKLRQELDKLKAELDSLLIEHTARHPDVINKRQQIRALESKIEALERKITESRPMPVPAPRPKDEPVPPTPNPEALQVERLLAELNAELKSLMEEEAKMTAAIGTYQARINNTSKREVELQELSRDCESTRDLYRTLLRRHQEAQLSENLEQHQKAEQFRVDPKAIPATTPSAPNRLRLLFVGLAASIGLAAALTLLAEQLDTSLHTIDELQATTNFPVLVSIPRIVTEGDVRRRWWRISLATAAAICVLVFLGGTTYYLASGNEQLLRFLSPGRF